VKIAPSHNAVTVSQIMLMEKVVTLVVWLLNIAPQPVIFHSVVTAW
jgi:hypothetical protein